MVRVAPIKLQVGPKVLWFDPTDLDIRAGDDVIVNTSRGLEYGIATSDVLEVSDDLVKDLKSPLKEVVRLATPEDMDKVRELEEKLSLIHIFKINRKRLPASSSPSKGEMVPGKQRISPFLLPVCERWAMRSSAFVSQAVRA